MPTCKSQKNTSDFAKNVVVAHRGAWKAEGLPENSIAALKHAIALKCTGSEFDVQMTVDDILVVNHDNDFNGMSIAQTSYSDLAAHKLSNGENCLLCANISWQDWRTIPQRDWSVRSSPPQARNADSA